MSRPFREHQMHGDRVWERFGAGEGNRTLVDIQTPA
jgi:hypothetical protein